jgi:putative PIN family toxin of toxin-antitoxin system
VRAAVDTSAWVATVLSRGGPAGRLFDAFRAGRFTAIVSEQTYAETDEVLKRPELVRTGEARLRARDLLATLQARAEVVPIQGHLKVCRDPNDDMVIETAIRGGADVLVSTDKDLTEDRNVAVVLADAGVRVLTVARFLEALEAEEQEPRPTP